MIVSRVFTFNPHAEHVRYLTFTPGAGRLVLVCIKRIPWQLGQYKPRGFAGMSSASWVWVWPVGAYSPLRIRAAISSHISLPISSALPSGSGHVYCSAILAQRSRSAFTAASIARAWLCHSLPVAGGDQAAR